MDIWVLLGAIVAGSVVFFAGILICTYVHREAAVGGLVRINASNPNRNPQATFLRTTEPAATRQGSTSG
jgi:hypothetical protein